MPDQLFTDTTAYIASGWREKAAANPGLIANELIQPIPMLENLVKEGRLGRKSGKGFFDVSFIEHLTEVAADVRQYEGQK